MGLGVWKIQQGARSPITKPPRPLSDLVQSPEQPRSTCNLTEGLGFRTRLSTFPLKTNPCPTPLQYVFSYKSRICSLLCLGLLHSKPAATSQKGGEEIETGLLSRNLNQVFIMGIHGKY